MEIFWSYLDRPLFIWGNSGISGRLNEELLIIGIIKAFQSQNMFKKCPFCDYFLRIYFVLIDNNSYAFGESSCISGKTWRRHKLEVSTKLPTLEFIENIYILTWFLVEILRPYRNKWLYILGKSGISGKRHSREENLGGWDTPSKIEDFWWKKKLLK